MLTLDDCVLRVPQYLSITATGTLLFTFTYFQNQKQGLGMRTKSRLDKGLNYLHQWPSKINQL
jgi:hypothetical protein